VPDGFAFGQPRASLGLRMITSLAKQLDGELSAESTAPGARFTLRFPLRPQSDGAKRNDA